MLSVSIPSLLQLLLSWVPAVGALIRTSQGNISGSHTQPLVPFMVKLAKNFYSYAVEEMFNPFALNAAGGVVGTAFLFRCSLVQNSSRGLI